MLAESFRIRRSTFILIHQNFSFHFNVSNGRTSLHLSYVEMLKLKAFFYVKCTIYGLQTTGRQTLPQSAARCLALCLQVVNLSLCCLYLGFLFLARNTHKYANTTVLKGCFPDMNDTRKG